MAELDWVFIAKYWRNPDNLIYTFYLPSFQISAIFSLKMGRLRACGFQPQMSLFGTLVYLHFIVMFIDLMAGTQISRSQLFGFLKSNHAT